MNKNYLKKNGFQGVVCGEGSAPSDEELALINAYTRRELTKDEVYAFSLTLCDNDVDRDGERFTVESLFALEKLFVGKTGKKKPVEAMRELNISKSCYYRLLKQS